MMTDITQQQYELALNCIEELLPLVTNETPSYDRKALELLQASNIVEAYEKQHYPIDKHTKNRTISK